MANYFQKNIYYFKSKFILGINKLGHKWVKFRIDFNFEFARSLAQWPNGVILCRSDKLVYRETEFDVTLS